MEEPLSNEELWELHRIVQEAALSAYPNPKRIGCPPHDILNEVAGKSWPADHPAYEHIKQCSPCLKEMLDLRSHYVQARQTAPSQKNRISFVLTCVSCVLIILLIGSSVFRLRKRAYTDVELATAPTRTVSLWDIGTFRGDQPSHLEAVSLPASLVHVNVILPRFSAPGKYRIAVARDQAGNNVIAEGTNATVAQGDQAVVNVVLDLRYTKPGAYFLSTTREHDEASNFYPLHVD